MRDAVVRDSAATLKGQSDADVRDLEHRQVVDEQVAGFQVPVNEAHLSVHVRHAAATGKYALRHWPERSPWRAE